MNKVLDKKITFGMLIRFSLPTIASMIFMSIYSTVDGAFVSQLVGTDALSAVNIVMPLILVSMAIGTMLGSGGTALIARKLGEGKEQEAKENFSLLIVVAAMVSVTLCALGLLFLKPLLVLLGADKALMKYCVEYAVPSLLMLPMTIFGMIFQMAFITVGRAKLGFAMSFIGGLTNVLLDYLFIGVWKMGISGAAIATGIGYCIPSMAGMVYFWLNRKGSLYLVKPRLDFSVIWKSCSNGVSEMVSSLANSVVIVLFNNILMRLTGRDGVASITIVMYAQSVLSAVYMGYAFGISPVISFNYGKQDNGRLKKIYSISLRTILAAGCVTFALGLFFTTRLVGIFVKPGTEVYEMAVRGYRLYSVCFLMLGINTFASAMFTALSDGKVSAILSFFRTLVFISVSVLLLPLVLGMDGVWLSMPLAELLSLCLTVYFFKKKKTVYHYA